MAGGPPRDGIPALKNPKFASASEEKFMRDNEQVLSLDIGYARS
jgi:hypothetical protein